MSILRKIVKEKVVWGNKTARVWKGKKDLNAFLVLKFSFHPCSIPNLKTIVIKPEFTALIELVGENLHKNVQTENTRVNNRVHFEETFYYAWGQQTLKLNQRRKELMDANQRKHFPSSLILIAVWEAENISSSPCHLLLVLPMTTTIKLSSSQLIHEIVSTFQTKIKLASMKLTSCYDLISF